MKRKACRICKMFIEGDECPTCKTGQFTLNWKGRIQILDSTKSTIAHKINIAKEGEYAIKVR